MKTLTQIVGMGGLLTVTIVLLSGCSTSEQPNYQGHKGTAPTVYDYYPSSKTNENKHK